jgi:drug/metabolite transporter (DMT)-like permease
VSGALWAALSGIGFGVFQVLNARVIRDVVQVYVATFAQLLVATAVFLGIVVATDRGGDLGGIPAESLGYFAVAGLLHFFLGWTTLAKSQKRIGAARTSPLIATSPVFGVVIALLLYGTVPGPMGLTGIAITVVGAIIVSDPGAGQRASFADSSFGLTTSAAWALSAVSTVAGLRGFADPLLGVTVGMATAALAYGLSLLLGARSWTWSLGREAWRLKVAAGVVVALATWWRWLGLADAPVGVVLALQLLTVPTVLLGLTVQAGTARATTAQAGTAQASAETVGVRVWAGAATVLLGVALLIATG